MNALVVLGLAVVLVLVVTVVVMVKVIKREIKKHGAMLIFWWFTGHHYGGAKACCAAGHCPPAVRWRKARRRILPFLLILTTVMAVTVVGSWPLALPVGLLAALVILWPRHAHRHGRRLAGAVAAPVAKRVSLPAVPVPVLAGRKSSPGTSAGWPDARKAPRTGPRRRPRSPARTGRSATPAPTSSTARLPGWSATTMRSCSRTSPRRTWAATTATL